MQNIIVRRSKKWAIVGGVKSELSIIYYMGGALGP
jgi:hypothetical protein